MSPMTFENVLINGVLVSVLGFFIRVWINGINRSLEQLKKDVNSKVDIATCERTHRLIDRIAHTHGSLGSSGEVIDQYTG